MKKNSCVVLAFLIFAACAEYKYYYSGDLPLDQNLLHEKFSEDKSHCEAHAEEKTKLHGGYPDDRWIKNTIFFPISCVSCNPEKYEEAFQKCMRDKDWQAENSRTHRKHLLFNRW